MPRRTGSRCKAKASTTLDVIVELCLVRWSEPIPGAGFSDIDAMRAAWEEHGTAITGRMIECLPGQRPAAAYILGEIPLPEPVNAPRAWDTVTRWGNRTFFPPWRYWGCTTGHAGHRMAGEAWGEMQHLILLGIVDAAEKRRAIRSGIDDRRYRPDAPWRHYSPLSHDTPHQADDAA